MVCQCWNKMNLFYWPNSNIFIYNDIIIYLSLVSCCCWHKVNFNWNWIICFKNLIKIFCNCTLLYFMLYEKTSYKSNLFKFCVMLRNLCYVTNSVYNFRFCLNLQVLCSVKFSVIFSILWNFTRSDIHVYAVYFLSWWICVVL